MTESKRIVEDGSPLERSIVEAADDYPPPRDLESRILATALSASTMARAAGAGGTTERRKPLLSFGTRRLVVALATLGLGAVIASSIASKSVRNAPPENPPIVAVVPPTVTLGHARAAEENQNEAPRDQAPAAVTPDGLPSAPPSAPVKTRPAPRIGSNAESTSSLRGEIALLDTIKTKLGARDVAGAASSLDSYDAEFPNGALRPEATVLRIRTLLAQGKRSKAERLADDFLKEHPGNVHSNRIRVLLAD